jgi:threonine/homoserine/homoserine lactone efflux protein
MEQISPYLSGILLAYGVVCIGILSPGPNVMAVIGTAMSIGRPQAKSLAWGISTGSFLWALLTWAGLVTIISAYASIMTAIKLFGAGYLLWLAFKAFRSAFSERHPKTSFSFGLQSDYFQQGLLVQMSNPKAAFSWIATMSLGLQADAPLWVGAAIVGGTTLISVVGHRAYAVAFSTAPMVSAYRKARRFIEAGLGMFFCFASYKLLTTRM